MAKNEILRYIFNKEELSNFTDFYDENWVENISELIKNTSLEKIAGNFMANCWGSAREFVLPWLLATGISDTINNKYSPSLVPLTPQRVWQEYSQIDGFHAALWKLSENVYCSIYFAYENLIVDILKKICGTKIRVTQKDFDKKLSNIYGKELTQKIWHQPFVHIARETRNSIVHNGGKVTENLLKVRPLPHYIQDDDVVISAAVTRELFNKLSPLAYDFVEESLRIIQK